MTSPSLSALQTFTASGPANWWQRMFPSSFPPQAVQDARFAQWQAGRPPAAGDREGKDTRKTTAFLLKAGSLQFVLDSYAQVQAAGLGLVSTQNADLWALRYAFGSNKCQEVWMDDEPASGVLKLNAVVTPSWHVGGNYRSRSRMAEKFARENRYVTEVYARSEAGDLTLLQRVEFGIQDPPEFSSASPTIEIDLIKHPQELVVHSWAQGSMGVGGNREGRETVIHRRGLMAEGVSQQPGPGMTGASGSL